MASLAESAPQGQCPPYPPGKSKLELLPTELLSPIFGHFAEDDLHSDLDLEEMRSLCLTSKRIDLVARPLLFETITISSPTTLILLRESLQQQGSRLGLYVKKLSFETLLDCVQPYDFLPLPSAHSASLLIDWDEFEAIDATGRSKEISRRQDSAYAPYCCDQILSACYLEILCATPRLHRLALKIWPAPSFYDGQHRGYLKLRYAGLYRRLERATRQSTTDDGAEFLPHLKILELIGDELSFLCNELSIGFCAPLLRLPALEKIACSQVRADFRELHSTGPNNLNPVHILNNVRSVDFQECHLYSEGFRGFGQLFPNLESFKLSFYYEPGWLSSDFPGDLQEALLAMKDLNTLMLEPGYLEGRRDSYVLGPALGNLSLTPLPKLATIRMPLRMVVGEQTTNSPGSMVDDHLTSILPKSLRRLVLTIPVLSIPPRRTDPGGEDTRPRFPPSSTAIALMEMLLRLGHKTFPHLEEVVLCYRLNGLDETISTDLQEADLYGLSEDDSQRLDQLRASIQRQNVRFSVAYEDV